METEEYWQTALDDYTGRGKDGRNITRSMGAVDRMRTASGKCYRGRCRGERGRSWVEVVRWVGTLKSNTGWIEACWDDSGMTSGNLADLKTDWVWDK